MNKNMFNSIKVTRPKSNHFDLTHDVKLSLNMGDLVPIMVQECVPGDRFNIGCESLIRFAPMVAPVMHRSNVTIHYFFVPNRILWPKWEDFITNTPDKVTNTLPAFPLISVYSDHIAPPDPGYTKLDDYLGIPDPTGQNNWDEVSALPYAAYQKIYNDYYRDQNLIEEIDCVLTEGSIPQAQANAMKTLRKRAWEHDYFTSALPFAQKGSPVSLPLGEVALKEDWDQDLLNAPHFDSTGTADQAGTVQNASNGAGGSQININGVRSAYDPNGSLEVQPTTINDLRRAFRLQEWLEKTARAGSRYVEQVFARFGVRSSDARMQRPEYITGTKSPVVISEIVNTTGTTDLPQGNLSGHGISVVNSRNGSYFCEEHGYIMGIMSIMPEPAYQQGIPKHFLKTKDPFQYYQPEFANIGEQEVENREIYAYQGSQDKATFGYVPRYAEYKYAANRVAGDFRGNLNHWHMGRIFATPPQLNKTFIECTPDDRIFAVTDPTEEKLYAHVLNKVHAVRLMPKFGTATI